LEYNEDLMNVIKTYIEPITQIFIPSETLWKLTVMIVNTLVTAVLGFMSWMKENPRSVIICAAMLVIATMDIILRRTLEALLVEKDEVNQRLNRINTLVRLVNVVREQWNSALEDLENKTQMVRECVEYWKQIRETMVCQNDTTALRSLVENLKNNDAMAKESENFGIVESSDFTDSEIIIASHM
ncbi:hypothetical protein L9F63_017254, partial [Diploptera punctata]